MDAPARAELARRCVADGIAAVHAGRLLAAVLASRARPPGTSPAPSVIAAGKAAAAMADAFLAWCDGRISRGIVAAPPGAVAPVSRLAVFAAGHPHPNDGSVAAGRASLDLARHLHADEQLFVLLSGGASALLAAPAAPVTLGDKIDLTAWCLTHGVPIDGLNAVRKHLSAIKGGQLATVTSARVHTFALSDVTRPSDDDAATIGSGPTVGDPTTFEQAWSVLEGTGAGWRTAAPRAAGRLRAGCDGRVPETPTPGDPRLARSAFHVIGNRRTAAAAAARAAGLAAVRVREEAIGGEARRAAIDLLDEAFAFADRVDGPCVYVATGETTVTVTGRGTGGRNQELALAAALELQRRTRRATVCSAGTDGMDGPTLAAGAVADETTVARARLAGLDPVASLRENDSHTFFAALGDTIGTGPTGTNVGDLVIVVVPPRELRPRDRVAP